MKRAWVDIEDVRTAIRDIKYGYIDSAIIYLQRAFADDSEIVEIIESEWRKP